MTLKFNELSDLCETAAAAAKEAGQYIQSRFKTHLEKRSKDGGDTIASQVVTEVDIKAQEIILNHLKASIHRYDLGLLTEELVDDKSRLVNDYFWCIDPMDGTLPFSEGKTGYAVSIALLSKEGNPVVGVVQIPDQAECYTAIKDTGVKLNGADFIHKNGSLNNSVQVYMDRSFTNESYFDETIIKLKSYASNINCELIYHDRFGGVRNAISVMNAEKGCYFKFPKKSKGCGSIWDYAATRLFFEELELEVFDAFGNSLFLNNPKTTFMNEVGILFATDPILAKAIIKLNN